MNKEFIESLFPKAYKNIKEGRCAICGKTINPKEFKDALSVKEFGISGLCQKCQDGVFY